MREADFQLEGHYRRRGKRGNHHCEDTVLWLEGVVWGDAPKESHDTAIENVTACLYRVDHVECSLDKEFVDHKVACHSSVHNISFRVQTGVNIS